MESATVLSDRWPVTRRARVRVRLCRYVVVGRIARVAPRAASPPGKWGPCVHRGMLGYGVRREDGTIEYWRPIRDW